VVQLTAGARDLLSEMSRPALEPKPVSCSVVTGRSYCRGKADGACSWPLTSHLLLRFGSCGAFNTGSLICLCGM